MRSVLVVLCTALLLVGCKSEKLSQVPADVLPEGQFTRIMADLSVIEAIKGMQSTKETEEKVEIEQLYAGIWIRENITEEQFKSSYAYYGQDLIKMSELQTAAALIIKTREDHVIAKKRASKAEAQEEESQEGEITSRKIPRDSLKKPLLKKILGPERP